MARKRKAAEAAVTDDTAITSPEDTVLEPKTAPDTSFNPQEFDPAHQQQAAAIVQQVADATALPGDHTPPPTASGGPGTVRANGGGFAEKVGKREPGYTQQGTTDYIAGARIHEYHNAEAKKYLTIIKFDEKPSKEITSMLRKAGFEFSYENQEWNRPIRFETRQQDRINADEVFAEACKLIRAEKGITHSYGGNSPG